MKKLLDIFSQFILCDQALSEICCRFELKYYQKNELVQKEGFVANFLYFIDKGTLIIGNELEHKTITRYMAKENEFLACIDSFINRNISKEFIQATEPTTVYRISKDDFDVLVKKYPGVGEFCQKYFVESLIKCQQRITDLISLDSKSYYKNIVENNPEYIQKMNQYNLASFMGIKPESLSRIRKPD